MDRRLDVFMCLLSKMCLQSWLPMHMVQLSCALRCGVTADAVVNM
jgi:hypothetical protein